MLEWINKSLDWLKAISESLGWVITLRDLIIWPFALLLGANNLRLKKKLRDAERQEQQAEKEYDALGAKANAEKDDAGVWFLIAREACLQLYHKHPKTTREKKIRRLLEFFQKEAHYSEIIKTP